MSAPPEDKVIMTTSGPVTGINADGVNGYLGIHYAAPPVGDLRWKPPIAPEPWKEPRRMNKFGAVCAQSESALTPKLEEINEDCLTLNVWTPARSNSELFPVMMYLHGGAFARGTGSQPIYNTPHLAQKGVVLVTINYRVGAFGFLAHPDLTTESPHHSSGNYGIMDQIMALKWIKENIRQFGGNPDNVTIFGQSAGGASVIALMASPLAKGLFHRAIAQSGGYNGTVIRHLRETSEGLDSMESLGMGFAERLGIAKTNALKELRAKPWQEIVTAWENTVQTRQTNTRVAGGWMLNHVIVDGYVLEQAPGKVFKLGKQHNVPFMTGTTADEGSIMPYLMNLFTVEKYHTYLKKCFGQQCQRVLELYPAQDNASVRKVLGNLHNGIFMAAARAVAQCVSAIQPNTYMYLFTMQPKIFTFQIPDVKDWHKEFGCYHAAELPYLFHFLPGSGIRDEDRRLSEQMMGYWVRFACSGDPNGDGATQWPAYAPSRENYIILDNPIKTGQHLNNDACDIIDELAWK